MEFHHNKAIRNWFSSNWLSVAAIVVSILAAYFSHQAIHSSESVAATNLYTAFKTRFETLITNAPRNRNNQGYASELIENSSDWRFFEDYWYQSFNEWYASKAMPGSFAKDLWNDYYGPAQKITMSKPHYLRVLCSKIEQKIDEKGKPIKNIAFAGHAEDYRKALLNLYHEKNDAPPECLSKKTRLHFSELKSSPVEEERDEILMLLTYAVVYKDWQGSKTPWNQSRGHNIGAILVDAEGQPVFWARNANIITKNSSQHAEVRLIRNFLEEDKNRRYLHSYTIYSSLESCAMCTGMMALTKVSRVVFGQRDPIFGHAHERLFQTLTYPNTNKAKSGYNSYPRIYKSSESTSSIARKLDTTFSKLKKEPITAWLRSEKAKSIYEEANEQFAKYSVKYENNRQLYTSAEKFLDTVSKDYVKLPH